MNIHRIVANVNETSLLCRMQLLNEAFINLVTQLKTIYEDREANNIAHLLFEEITGLNKSDRLINKETLFTSTQQLMLDRSLVQLMQNQPIQQVLGYAWFMNEKFVVSKDVLIPRPETEELIDWIIKDFENIKPSNILDIGCGSGIIAISLKKHFKQANVQAIDISEKALFIALQNAVSKSLVVNFSTINLLDETTWNNLAEYDIIVSNPPYITNNESLNMNKNVFQYEPHIALFVENDNPLIFYKAITKFALKHLSKNGKIFVEINEQLGAETLEVFIKNGFEAELKKDLQGKDRMIKAWKRN